MTEWRMARKAGFSERESGVGGREEVDPMASFGLGGEVGRRVRRWLFRERLSGKTY
jgi:hypothetical protein